MVFFSQNNRSHEFLAKQTGVIPFFAMVSTPACHSPFTSAPQYVNKFANEKAPRDGSFNVAGKVGQDNTKKGNKLKLV